MFRGPTFRPQKISWFPHFCLENYVSTHRKACKLNFYWKICGIFCQGPPLEGSKIVRAPPFLHQPPPHKFLWTVPYLSMVLFSFVVDRYASLYFCCAIEETDNELITLEIIHRYVELLDKYFGSVSMTKLNKFRNFWSTRKFYFPRHSFAFFGLGAFVTDFSMCRNISI